MKNISKKLCLVLALVFGAVVLTACFSARTDNGYDTDYTIPSRQSSGQTVGRAAVAERSVEILNADNALIESGGIIRARYFPQDVRPIFRLKEAVPGIAVIGNRVWFEADVPAGRQFTVVAEVDGAYSERTLRTHEPNTVGINITWETTDRYIRNFDDIFVTVSPARHTPTFRLRDPVPGMFVETIEQSYARVVYSTHVPAGTEFTVVAELENGISSERTFVATDGGVFFDDFSGGLESLRDNWYLGSGAWGAQVENGGVVPSNVMLTSDGYLALAANGDFYRGDTTNAVGGRGIRTGAAIISRNIFGPGAFEVRAKMLPRIGACSALWTFYHRGEEINHEIDFETP